MSESDEISSNLAELAVLSARCSSACLSLMNEVQRFSGEMKIGYFELLSSNDATIRGNVDFCVLQFKTYLKALDSATAVFTQIVEQLPEKE